MDQRVVTTLPAATEIVAALGVEPEGVSHECDYPPAVAEPPTVTVSGENGEFHLDQATVEAIDPDVVVTQGTCDVCAIDAETVVTELAETTVDPTVVRTDIHRLDGLFADIKRIGATLGRVDAAASLIEELQARVDRVRKRVPEDESMWPSVAVLDWLDPVMVAGHWVPDLVAAAGGEYALESAGEPARPREWEAIRQYDPAVLVLAPCGYPIGQTRAALDAVTDRPGWADLQAVKTGQVYVIDGSQYINRPGPRLVDTVEHLAGLLHPSQVEAPPETAVQPLEATRGRS